MNEDPTAVAKFQYIPYASAQDSIRLKCFNLKPVLRSRSATQEHYKEKGGIWGMGVLDLERSYIVLKTSTYTEKFSSWTKSAQIFCLTIFSL